MKKIYLYRDAGGCPIDQFLSGLPPKQRQKMLRQLVVAAHFPAELHEPQVKHFKMHRYRQLYELREKHQCTLLRIIFTLDADDNIVLLEPFIKNHRRKTNTALEAALVKMRRIELDPAHFLSEMDVSAIPQHLGWK